MTSFILLVPHFPCLCKLREASSSRLSARPYIWVRAIPNTSTGWNKSSFEKDLGVLGDKKHNMSQAMCTHRPESQTCPGLHSMLCGQQGEGEDSVPLLYLGDIPPTVLCPSLGSPAQERLGPAGAGPEGIRKRTRGQEQLCHKYKLSELGVLRLEKGRLW